MVVNPVTCNNRLTISEGMQSSFLFTIYYGFTSIVESIPHFPCMLIKIRTIKDPLLFSIETYLIDIDNHYTYVLYREYTKPRVISTLTKPDKLLILHNAHDI